MGSVFAYSLYSSILLTGMYLCYKWILSGENQHCFNRMVLWMIYIVSFCAWPVVSFAGQVCSKDMQGDVVVGDMDIMAVIDAGVTDSFGWADILLAVYIVGMAVTGIATVIAAVRLSRLVSGGRKMDVAGSSFTLVIIDNQHVAPFSWCRYVVMDKVDYEQSGDMIMEHELRHIKGRHWIDMMMAQLVVIFQWFNPAAWLMREELKAVHEYQADDAVVKSGFDMRKYQMLLIKKAVGTRFPSLANSLNHSKLKKRITMMYKSKTSAGRRMRALAIVPAVAAALVVTKIPVVASTLSSALSSTLEFTADKGSEKSQQKQGMTVSVTSCATSGDTEVLTTNGKISKIVFNGKEFTEEEARAAGLDIVNVNVGDYGNTVTNLGKNGIEIFIDGKRASMDKLNELDVNAIAQIKVDRTGDTSEVNIMLNKDGNTDSGEALKSCDRMPSFPGGDVAMMRFVYDNIRYPKDSDGNMKEPDGKGSVVVQFEISDKGKVGNAKVIRSAGKAFDEEALRIVGIMPDFIPGEHNGKAVKVSYTLPIMFRMHKK